MAESKLSNVEYIALQIFLNPGQSGRFYLRKLHQYRFPRIHKEFPKSNFGAIYMAPSGRYFGKLWKDHAIPTTQFSSFLARGKRPRAQDGWGYLRPKVSKWHLTPAGIEKARVAAAKLGLKLEGLEITDQAERLSKGTFKSQLVAWWKAQPGPVTRKELQVQYGKITGRLDENGQLVGDTWREKNSYRYVSLTVNGIINQWGVQAMGWMINPETGRRNQLWSPIETPRPLPRRDNRWR